MKIGLLFVVISAYILCSAFVIGEFPSALVRTASSALFAPDSGASSRITLTAFDDIIIHCAAQSPEIGAPTRIHIRQRDVDGNYNLIRDLDNPWGALHAVTNGKWLALVVFDKPLVMGLLDADYNLVNATEIGYTPVAGGFFSEDTFVLFDHPNTFRTLQYTPESGWIEDTTLTFILPVSQYLASTIGPAFTLGEYVMSLNFPTVLYINQRLENGSWAQVDSIPDLPTILLSSNGIVLYDGVDTVVISSFAETNDGTGLLAIYKKTGGQWAMLQEFNLSDLGVTGDGGAGGSLAMPDQNTILFGVPITYNYSTPSLPSGKVFVIRRNETGLWAVTSSLYTNERLTFGYNVIANQYDYVMTGLDSQSESTFFSIPKCFDTPINATCQNLDLDDSCNFDTSSLYTISGLECGSVTTKLTGVQVTDNYNITADYLFTRNFVSATCTSQITCPIPPVSPVAVVPPVAATTPTGKTSVGNQFKLIYSAGLLLFVFALLF